MTQPAQNVLRRTHKVMDTAPFTLEITQDAPAAFHAPPCSGSLDLRLGDCMEGMKTFPDGHFDLAVVDPPYGIKIGERINSITGGVKHTPKTWDDEPPPVEYFAELRRVSKHQIVWGANHFIERLPINSACWIVWDKNNGDSLFADGELAWASFSTPARIVKCHWCGSAAIHETGRNKIHPTQKPVKLYDWLFSKYAKPGHRVLDTHMGSGSIAIAAHYAGIHLTAYEIDADYFHAAKARIARETSQAELFSPQNKEDQERKSPASDGSNFNNQNEL